MNRIDLTPSPHRRGGTTFAILWGYEGGEELAQAAFPAREQLQGLERGRARESVALVEQHAVARDILQEVGIEVAGLGVGRDGDDVPAVVLVHGRVLGVTNDVQGSGKITIPFGTIRNLSE